VVLAAVAGLIPGFGADAPIHAKVERVVATHHRLDDPEVAGFKVKFGVLLTNQSGEPLDLPKPQARNDRRTRVEVLGLQAKRPDGSWTHLFQSSRYDTGAIQYESCVPLPPGGVSAFADVSSGFVLLKSQVVELGNQPSLRLDLLILCGQPGGRVVSRAVTTEEFELRLAGQP
jgi:hypothetical protein